MRKDAARSSHVPMNEDNGRRTTSEDASVAIIVLRARRTLKFAVGGARIHHRRTPIIARAPAANYTARATANTVRDKNVTLNIRRIHSAATDYILVFRAMNASMTTISIGDVYGDQ